MKKYFILLPLIIGCSNYNNFNVGECIYYPKADLVYKITHVNDSFVYLTYKDEIFRIHRVSLSFDIKYKYYLKISCEDTDYIPQIKDEN